MHFKQGDKKQPHREDGTGGEKGSHMDPGRGKSTCERPVAREAWRVYVQPEGQSGQKNKHDKERNRRRELRGQKEPDEKPPNSSKQG